MFLEKRPAPNIHAGSIFETAESLTSTEAASANEEALSIIPVAKTDTTGLESL